MKQKSMIRTVILAATVVLIFAALLVTQVRGAADSMDSTPFDRLDKKLFARTERIFSEEGRELLKVPSPDGSWRGLCIDRAGHFYSVCKGDGTVIKMVQDTGKTSEVFQMNGRIFGFCFRDDIVYFQHGDRDRKAARLGKLLGRHDYNNYMMNIEYWRYSFEDEKLQEVSKKEYKEVFKQWREFIG